MLPSITIFDPLPFIIDRELVRGISDVDTTKKLSGANSEDHLRKRIP